MESVSEDVTSLVTQLSLRHRSAAAALHVHVTRSSDAARLRNSSVQIPLNGPDQTSSLVGSGRVVSEFHALHGPART